MHMSVFSSRVGAAGFPWGTFMKSSGSQSNFPPCAKNCDVKNPCGGSLNLSYNFIYSFQKTSFFFHPPPPVSRFSSDF